MPATTRYIDRPSRTGGFPQGPRVALLGERIRDIAPRLARVALPTFERVSVPIDRLRRRRVKEIDASILNQQLGTFRQGWLSSSTCKVIQLRCRRWFAQRKEKRRRVVPFETRAIHRIGRCSGLQDERKINSIPGPRFEPAPRHPHGLVQINSRTLPDESRTEILQCVVVLFERTHPIAPRGRFRWYGSRIPPEAGGRRRIPSRRYYRLECANRLGHRTARHTPGRHRKCCPSDRSRSLDRDPACGIISVDVTSVSRVMTPAPHYDQGD